MKILLQLFILSISSTLLYSQVGLGITNPTAALEIKTENTGIAALGLSPQTNPSGTQTGQMAVIGGILYMFDAIRDKWLSVENTGLEFGRRGSGSDPAEVEFGGGDLQTGPTMPFDGTIVGINMSAGADNSREIFLFINDVAVPNNDSNIHVDGVFILDQTTLQYQDNDYNLDFQAGDIIRFSIDSDVDDIESLIINLQVRWRKDNS